MPDTVQPTASGDPILRRTARALRRGMGLTRQAVDNRRALRASTMTTARPESPHIVLDGCVFQESPEGIARVWETVMRQWSESGFARHITVLDRDGTAPRLPGFTYRSLPRIRERDSASQRSMLQAVCTRERANLFVSTLYTTPSHTQTALLVYDLTPEVLGWDLRLPMWRERIHAIHHASSHACISKSTATDLHRLYPDSAEKPCSVVPLAVDESFAPVEDSKVESLRTEFGLPETYFLFMGLRDEYKNAALVLETLAGYPADPGFAVLFVGGSLQPESEVARRAGTVPVRVARRLSESELRAAYTGAAALLYPSLYEGFGLPVLEAMACGCPVICSDRASLPEVAGEGALYVDPTSSAALAAAMRAVLRPETRADLVDRGLENCRRFSWEQTARQLGEALLDAANSAASQV